MLYNSTEDYGRVKLKKIICFLVSLNLIFPSGIVYSQRRASSASSRVKRATTKSNNKKSNSRSQSSNVKTGTEGGNEGGLTCEEKYNLCMDNVCLNEQGIRYLCDTATDSFDTVDRDGEKFRVGNDLYTFAKGVCESTLKSCDLKERNHIQTAYMAKIKEDLLTKNYLDAMNAASDETQREVLDELIQCMAPLCGNYFSDCFTIKNIERRIGSCDTILNKSSRPLTVKKMFYEEIENQRKEVCSSVDGYVDYDTKVCKVTVSYGKPEIIESDDGQVMATGKMKKEVASRIFNMGEIVECTQEYFSTTSEKKPFLRDAIKDFAFGAVKSVAGAALVVVGAAATAFTFGAGSIETVPMIMNGASLICKGAASTLNGAVKMNITVKEGGCFINKKYVAPMGSYFKVNFMN